MSASKTRGQNVDTEVENGTAEIAEAVGGNHQTVFKKRDTPGDKDDR